MSGQPTETADLLKRGLVHPRLEIVSEWPGFQAPFGPSGTTGPPGQGVSTIIVGTRSLRNVERDA